MGQLHLPVHLIVCVSVFMSVCACVCVCTQVSALLLPTCSNVPLVFVNWNNDFVPRIQQIIWIWLTMQIWICLVSLWVGCWATWVKINKYNTCVYRLRYLVPFELATYYLTGNILGPLFLLVSNNYYIVNVIVCSFKHKLSQSYRTIETLTSWFNLLVEEIPSFLKICFKTAMISKQAFKWIKHLPIWALLVNWLKEGCYTFPLLTKKNYLSVKKYFWLGKTQSWCGHLLRFEASWANI